MENHWAMARLSNLRQCLPSPPKVRVCDDADSFTELCLYIWRGADHKTNQTIFYLRDLSVGELVVSLLILEHWHLAS
jgi:hypothetical protein